LADAQHRGAVAAIVEQAQEINLPQFLVPSVLEAAKELACAQRLQWGDNGRRPLVAIGGSYGKTSMKDILALLLGERTLATFENRNNILGIVLTLSRLKEESHDRAVIEIGIDRPGEMSMAMKMVMPDVGIITGIAPVHVVNFKSLEQLVEEKAQLLRCVKTSGGRIYFPSSCLCYAPFRTLADAATITVSLSDKKRSLIFPSTELVHDFDTATSRLTLCYPKKVLEIYSLASMSHGQVANMALAIGVAKDMGYAREYLQERMGQWQSSTGRGQWKSYRRHRVYWDCYNANPVAMKDAVEFFHHETPCGRRIWILGGMRELGAYAEEAHRQLGQQLPVRSGDVVMGIGPEMAIAMEAIRERAESGVEVLYAETAVEAKEWVASREGIFFVKGSRFYALEQLFGEI
jgi:UDP-N-acetylmuramoyl-tripeptide--D-alanyl-D-alanine ligase